MANCNDLFQKFLSEISVTTEQRANLQRGRDAIKGKIEKYFSNELKVASPEFCLQGSYPLKTMVRPLGQEDYDLDDGVYLKHTDDDISNPTPATASGWIVGAVKKHTKKNPINKKNCVRVVYAEDYHIDLPIYREIKGKPYLGTLDSNQWILSDAKAFNDWFHTRLKKTEQLRSCIKYLKGWKDFKSCDLKGIHLTILVGLNYVAITGRDDNSLAQTVQNIIAYLKNNSAIYNPVDTGENLIFDWSFSKINKTIESLEKLHAKALEALDEEEKSAASQKWITVFGTRFPEHDEEMSEGKVAAEPLSRDQRTPVKVWGKR